MTPNRPPDLPLLAVAHGARSLSMFQLLAATADLCRVLWLVDGGEPETSRLARPLARFGPVVDVAGVAADELAHCLGEHAPDGIVAYRDRDIAMVSELAGRLGLPYHTQEVSERLVDKLRQREALAAAGLPTPRFAEVQVSDDPLLARTVAEQVGFPVMIKPRRGNGSAQVSKAGDLAELERELAARARSGTFGGEFLVEEFLDDLPELGAAGFASFVSVESIVVGGQVHHLATNGRTPLAEPFRETGTFIPSPLGSELSSDVAEVATAAAGALGVRQGCLHTEIKLTPEGPRVLEVNGRIGGGVPDMLRLASGFDLLRTSMLVALGGSVVPRGPLPCNQVGYRLMHQPPATAATVDAVGGLEEVAHLPGVDRVFLHNGPGTTIDPRDGTSAYVYEVVGAVADHEGLHELQRRLLDMVSISYGRRAS